MLGAAAVRPHTARRAQPPPARSRSLCLARRRGLRRACARRARGCRTACSARGRSRGRLRQGARCCSWAASSAASSTSHGCVPGRVLWVWLWARAVLLPDAALSTLCGFVHMYERLNIGVPLRLARLQAATFICFHRSYANPPSVAHTQCVIQLHRLLFMRRKNGHTPADHHRGGARTEG